MFLSVGPCRGGGSHVARLNCKTSRVGVYKCLRILSALPSLSQFGRARLSFVILRAVATFWAMSLVRIYPSRPSNVNGCYFSRQKKKTIVGTTTAKEKADKETDRQWERKTDRDRQKAKNVHIRCVCSAASRWILHVASFCTPSCILHADACCRNCCVRLHLALL